MGKGHATDETYGTHGTNELGISPIGPISPIRANTPDVARLPAAANSSDSRTRTTPRNRLGRENTLIRRADSFHRGRDDAGCGRDFLFGVKAPK